MNLVVENPIFVKVSFLPYECIGRNIMENRMFTC